MNQEEVKKMTSEVFQQLIDKARKEGNTNELTRLFAQAQIAQDEDEDEDENLNDPEPEEDEMAQAQLAQAEENPDEDEDEDLNESDQYDEV